MILYNSKTWVKKHGDSKCVVHPTFYTRKKKEQKIKKENEKMLILPRFMYLCMECSAKKWEFKWQ